ncbi:alpha-actinin [Anaeramoeba flamelloides]|uniref:Alpha-actinin n=1 Tax=Anaeramoeba flamelloides TaxID=1746091 RepID=A0ABQ8XQ33_9EUKA|nr:alpha-actinin [Anaeramoeba flamelloides]
MSIMDQSWVKVQQKAFTRWCNAHLGKRGLKLNDMQKDFKSGINLLQLLEVIGEHTFGRYNKKPRMEIQMRENLQIALKFIEDRGVKLTSIGAGDIFQGNLKLILGMIWTVILRFAIAEISVEELTAKEALLLWCQRKTVDYDNVDIKEFSWSWQDGLGFCALIHKHRPDLIDYESLDPKNKEDNLNLAFDIAEKELGLPKFLDAEDMIDVKPDERAVMTYLAEYFKYFSKGQKAENAGRRIGKVAALTREINEMIDEFEKMAGPLKEWIEKKNEEIPNYKFDNTLEGVEKLIDELNDFKNNEKPPKLKEKNEVATALNNLKIKISNNKRPAYKVPEGITTENIDKLWDEMENKEKDRTLEQQKEYSRQKLLKKLVEEFNRRVANLEKFAEKKEEYLNTKEEIDTLPQAKTKIKVLEAYHKEYEVSKSKLEPCVKLGKSIIFLAYREKDQVQEKIDELQTRWENLQELENKKNEQLQEDLKRELKKEELRKEFAKQAREYNRWQKDQVEVAQDRLFGNDLASVTDYKTKLDETTNEITNASNEKKESLEDLDKQLTELGSTDNKYSTLTIDDIRGKHDQLMNLLNERKDAYEKELERQTIMENKRKEFAELVNNFAEFLQKIRKDINAVEGEPEDMVSGIENIYQEGKEIDEKVEQMKKVDQEQKELGIRSNRHTKYDAKKLAKSADELKKWAEKLIAHWKQEKVKKDKRIEFAELANEFGPFLEKIRKDINDVKGEPEDALPKVEDIYQEGKEIDEKLEALKKVDNESKVLMTGANPYTKYTYKQLEDTSNDLKEFAEETIENWKQEKVKKDKRIEFGKLADALGELLTEKRKGMESLKGEPEDMISGFKDIYQEGTEIDEKVAELKKVDDECNELMTGENPYTKYTYPQLEDTANDLKKWAEKSIKNWEQEKVKKDKRKEFAEIADAFGELLQKKRNDINAVEGEPEDMISGIENIYQEGTDIDEKLSELEKVDKEQKELGIRSNKYTKYTYPSLEKSAKQFKEFAEESIAHWKQEKVKKDKRIEFGKLADALGELLTEKRKGMESLKGEPEDMISGFKDIYQEGTEIDEKVSELKKVDDECNELMTGENPYTKYTYPQLEDTANDLKAWAEKSIKNWEQEKVKKDKRIEFGKLADAFGEFLDNKRKDINAVSGEPEEMVSGIEDIYQEGTDIDEKLAELEKVDKEQKELGIRSNKYTKHTYLQLAKSTDKLKKWAEKTIAHWKQEKVKKDKRIEFGKLADAFGEFLETKRNDINAVSGEPEDMISGIEEIYQEGTEIDEKLAELEKVDKEQKELGIRSNKYTKHTYPSLVDSTKVFKDFAEDTIKEWKEEKVRKDKRKEFAQAADEYASFLDEKVKTLNGVEGEPEDRLEKVTEIYQEGKDINEKLEELKKVDDECNVLMTGENPYTKWTYEMLDNRTKQVNQFANSLLNSIKEDKEHKDRSIQQDKENKESERIENLRIDYFDKAEHLKTWLDEVNEFLNLPIYSTSSEEVKELIDKYNTFVEDKPGKEEPLNETRNMFQELTDAGVEDFLGLPIDDINTAWEQMGSNIDNKKTELDEALAVQEKNEELCKDYANKAEELNQYLKEQQTIINEESSGSIDEQIETVKSQLNEFVEKKKLLDDTLAVDTQIAERNVEIKTTTIRATDLVTLYNQVSETIQNKLHALEKEKLIKEGSKVTQEQLTEFKQMFELFDKDKKGSLFPYEFSGVLNSLGDDLDEDEIKQVFDKYDEDKSGSIEFNEFVDFMTSRVQDADTLEQSLESWKVIAKDKEYVTKQDMQMAGMDVKEIDYLCEQMDAKEDGFDYKGWCTKVYGEN